MAESQSVNNADLIAQVKALEDETRKLLAALRWSATVRSILLILIIAFVVVFGVLFYLFYQDITNNRITQTQDLLIERQDEFIEPLSKAVFGIAESSGPEVIEIFRAQAVKDSQRYIVAFNEERDAIAKSFRPYLEERINEEHAKFLKQQESAIVKEFPELEDPAKMAKFRTNLEKTFEQIAKRYYVDFFQKEFDQLLANIDSFPPIDPEDGSIPLAEQVVLELMKLAQMMVANADKYVSEPVELTAEASTTEGEAETSAETKSDDDEAAKDDDQKSADDESDKGDGDK